MPGHNKNMEVRVGTSGWMYDWNPNGLDWYLKYSGLNTVEINSTFYRFPYPNMAKSWYRKTVNLDFKWSVKVYRGITHFYRLSQKALEQFEKFVKVLGPLNELIEFYLFQLPPSFAFSEKQLEKLQAFFQKTKQENKIAVEFRHPSWFNEVIIEKLSSGNIVVVSVDAPDISFYVKTNETIYYRLHGRTYWYSHYYTKEELYEIKEKILKSSPKKVYVYFNNDHDMLSNARTFFNLMTEKTHPKY